MRGPVIVFFVAGLLVALVKVGIIGLGLILIAATPLFININKLKQYPLLIIPPALLYLIFSLSMRDASGPDGMGLIILFGCLSVIYIGSLIIKVIYIFALKWFK